jgi:hypothetical protein
MFNNKLIKFQSRRIDILQKEVDILRRKFYDLEVYLGIEHTGINVIGIDNIHKQLLEGDTKYEIKKRLNNR